MSRKEDYLKAMIETYLKHIDYKGVIDIDNKIIENLLSNSQLSEGLEMIDTMISDTSKELLPLLELDYKIANISVGKTNNLKPELLNIVSPSSDKYHINEISGLEDIGGISWNPETQSFEGKAENSGTFTIEIKGLLISQKGYTQHTKGISTLTVIPDPKSLWKTIEPDESIEYGKPHGESASAEASDGSRLLYASKRGRSHAHVGTYRDDDGKILAAESGWSILSIADGGGSYPLSRRGSEIAVEKSIFALEKILSGKHGKDLEEIFFKNKENSTDELRNLLDSKLKETILSAAYTGFKGISDEAEENKNDIKEYSTTLLLSAHKKTKQGHLVLTFWVGDGVVALYTKEKEVILLGVPDSGEFAGQTRFLDTSFFYDTSRVNIQLVDSFTALILATDGVSDPYFETDESLESVEKWDDFWAKISPFVTQENINSAHQELLEWLDFWSKGNHDDRTIALLLRGEESAVEMATDEPKQINDTDIEAKSANSETVNEVDTEDNPNG